MSWDALLQNVIPERCTRNMERANRVGVEANSDWGRVRHHGCLAPESGYCELERDKGADT